jgi:ferredoxin
MTITAAVDWDKCEGAGTCTKLAPEIFDIKGGFAEVILDDIPESLLLKATFAMRQCPTKAISINNPDGGSDATP